MDCNQIWILLKPTIKVIIEQLPGLVISLVTSFFVAQVYFNRQRMIDKEKQEKEVRLCQKRLMHAYITTLGKRPKNGNFYVHEAMDNLTTSLAIYRPEFDANKWLKDTAEEAKKFIADHPNDFEDIPKVNQSE